MERKTSEDKSDGDESCPVDANQEPTCLEHRDDCSVVKEDKKEDDVLSAERLQPDWYLVDRNNKVNADKREKEKTRGDTIVESLSHPLIKKTD